MLSKTWIFLGLAVLSSGVISSPITHVNEPTLTPPAPESLNARELQIDAPIKPIKNGKTAILHGKYFNPPPRKAVPAPKPAPALVPAPGPADTPEPMPVPPATGPPAPSPPPPPAPGPNVVGAPPPNNAVVPVEGPPNNAVAPL